MSCKPLFFVHVRGMATLERIPQDRLPAADLRGLSDDQMEVLRREAMRRGCSFGELLGQLVDEVSTRILKGPDLPA
jgi:hypothetical protein